MMSNNGQILLYQTEEGGTEIQVNLRDETVWLSQSQMATLFQREKSTISEHISNIISEGELQENSVVRNFRTTASSCNSPSSKIFLICSLIVDLLF